VQQSVIESIFREALILKMLNCKYLLPIEGIIFNRKSQVMHIFYPQKISLYEYLHESGTQLSPEDKYTIAKNIAHALSLLHSRHNPPAHTHLTSKNIMLNPSDHHVYITDYSLRSLKNFAK
jgi:serine/threonine protein kinase